MARKAAATERSYARSRHVLVAKVLGALDAAFLAQAQCYFGGGTRTVLALNEYRESADIDFLCSSREGYRALRSTIRNNSLGHIASGDLMLARDVIADRYGIRTVFDVNGDKIKFEIINEGRIEIGGALDTTIGVPCLNAVSCFAEKFLANADRWNDDSFANRDIVDLAFMIQGWGVMAARKGAATAAQAYGASVRQSATAAAQKLLKSRMGMQRAAARLAIRDTETLSAGLQKLIAMR